MKNKKNTTKQKENSEMSFQELKETENRLYAEYCTAERELKDYLKNNPLAIKVESLRKKWNVSYTVVQNAERIAELEKQIVQNAESIAELEKQITKTRRNKT